MFRARALETLTSPNLHQRVRQRFVERLSVADRQQMLLATATDDFRRLSASARQLERNRTGAATCGCSWNASLRMVWIGARLMVARASLGSISGFVSFHPRDQVGEDAIDHRDLQVTEAIDIGQEQVRHLAKIRASCSGPSSSAPFNSARKFGDAAGMAIPPPHWSSPARRTTPFFPSSRHAFRPTVGNASSSGRSIARTAGVVDPSAVE